MADRAVALRYEGEGAPSVIATGRGAIAEKIIEIARASGVPLREDPALVDALASLELGTEVPPELYKAVAEALVWAYRLSRRRGTSIPKVA